MQKNSSKYDLNKKYIITLLVLIIISLTVNIFLIKYSYNIYRQYRKCQIDPSNSSLYRNLNRKIKKKLPDTIRVVLFGDSRIYMWNPLPIIPECEIINRGAPGETTAQSILRLQQDVISLNPDIVIIENGGNDCNSIGAIPDMENYITKNCKKNIETIIKALEKKQINVIFLSIFPVGTLYPHRFPIWSEKTRNAISDINKFLFQYDSQFIKVVNCDPVFLDDTNKMKKIYSSDFLHLNKAGYLKLNDLINPYIKTFIRDIKKN